MSKKLSQSEIDALVNSLLVSDPGGDSGAEAPAEPAPAAAPQPEVAAAPPSFEAIQDLGTITQAEVDAATLAYQAQKDGAAAAAISAPTAMQAPAAVQVPTPAQESTPAPAVEPVPQPAVAAAPQQAHRAPVAKPVLSMAAAGGAMMDIELTVSVELGRSHLTLREILNLGPGSVITLDKVAGEKVDVLVNRVPIMKAEVLAIGEKYGIRVTDSNLNGEPNANVRVAS